MIEFAFGFILGAVVAVFGTLRVLLKKGRVTPGLRPIIVAKAPAFADKRFRVVLSSERGVDARDLYEKVVPKLDGVVEFFEGENRRGMKKGNGPS